MANIFQISPATPIKWYRQSDVWNAMNASANATFGVFNPSYNTRHFDDDHWQRNLSRWMDKVTYFQPWQTNDIIAEQFLGIEEVGGVSYTVRLCTPEGVVVKSVSATSGAQVGSSDQYIWEYQMPLYDVPEGRYFLQNWHEPETAGNANFFIVSAPIEVKRKHEGTQLYRYYHSSNDQDVFYETGIQFYFRVHSQLMEFQPGAKRHVYEDQPLNLTMLSGITYREWQLVLGGMNYDFPEYMLDKIDRILNHDYLTIDGKEYTAVDGAKLDIERVKNSPLYGAKIAMREKDNSPAVVVDEYAEIICCDKPTARRFYVDSYTIPAVGVTAYIRKHFAGVDEFLGYANTVLISNLAEGTFFAVNAQDKIVLRTNQVLYSVLLAGFTFNDILQGWVACECADYDYELYVTSSAVFKYAFDNGDGVMTMTSGVTSATVGYSYTDSVVNYFFVDDANGFDFTATVTGTIRTIDGQLPASATYITIANQYVQRVIGNMFDRCTGSLHTINFAGNLLPALNVNENIMWAYDAYVLNALSLSSPVGIALNSQTPSAPPATDSGVKLFTQRLRSAGFPVVTD